MKSKEAAKATNTSSSRSSSSIADATATATTRAICPSSQQYEAVGHAVRAAFCYSAMTDVAMESGDPQYHSAVKSLWDNLVNRKYYLTGGIGSGETSEGFGKDFSLPNKAYCESCSGCGELFFQHKMNLAYHDATLRRSYRGDALQRDARLTGPGRRRTSPTPIRSTSRSARTAGTSAPAASATFRGRC